MSQNDGGPAFPVALLSGMSLRDYFAAAALPAMWDAFDKGYWNCEPEYINRSVAKAAYQMADALLAVREDK